MINIYQIFTRLFANQKNANVEFGTIEENGCTKFNDITDTALKEIKDFGATHVWFTGVIRHATCTDYSKKGLTPDNPHVVKGRAGSPYAIKDYFDVQPDFAENFHHRMVEFEELVERTHNAGLKCIIDFVPNHVSRGYASDNLPPDCQGIGAYDDTSVAFKQSNNFYYIPNESLVMPEGLNLPYEQNAPNYEEFPAKVTGNDVFSSHPSLNDWYETIKLNYGIDYQNLWHEHFEQIPDTWVRMLEVLTFWTNKGVDAFRCDMAEMVPVRFWGWVIPQIKEINPNIIFIAEVYNPDLYKIYVNKGKFDYLYDKVGLYDVLRLMIEGYGSAKYISDTWKCLEDLNPKMLRFLENHDEHRVASEFFGGSPESAKASMVVTATMNTGPMMIYFGQEVGEAGMDKEGYSGVDGKTTIFDYWTPKEHHKWVNDGKFDGAKLSKRQKDLRNFYKKLQHIRLENEALAFGEFYDLMWKNYGGNLDADKIYAFVRYTENQKLLIVVNFDYDNDHSFNLNFGEHAIEVIQIPQEGNICLTDIFQTKFKETFDVEKEMLEGLSLNVAANSALILELS